MSARHVLGDHATDSAQGLATPLSASAGGADIILGDSSARSSPRDGDEIDTELLRDSANDGCRLDSLHRSRRRCHSSRPVSLGCRDDSVEALAGCADDDELSSDGRELTFGHEDLQHRPGVRRRDLDGRLVGLDLDERVVLGDLLPLRDEPAGDLALGEALPQVRKLERARHRQPDSRAQPRVAHATDCHATRAWRAPRAR